MTTILDILTLYELPYSFTPFVAELVKRFDEHNDATARGKICDGMYIIINDDLYKPYLPMEFINYIIRCIPKQELSKRLIHINYVLRSEEIKALADEWVKFCFQKKDDSFLSFFKKSKTIDQLYTEYKSKITKITDGIVARIEARIVENNTH